MTTNQGPRSVTFKGANLALSGSALKEGDNMPGFTLTAQDMSDLKSDSFRGKILIISCVPSLDTAVCSIQTKHFNKSIEKLSDKVVVLTVSLDLPFAQKRWCGAEGCTRVITGSDYKYRSFGKTFGAFIDDWGLLARAVFVVDQKGQIIHVEYVSELSSEPNYDAVFKKVSTLLENNA